jgi:glucose/arabinose dehydrogenase
MPSRSCDPNSRREAFSFFQIFDDLDLRVRDVRQGPDGLIYLITGENDGAVLRIEPAP